jgi:hypothetical protein
MKGATEAARVERVTARKRRKEGADSGARKRAVKGWARSEPDRP